MKSDDLYRMAFAQPRSPRSDAYKSGVLALLQHKLDDADLFNPYTPGTAESDAWFAGVDEGHFIMRRYEMSL